MEWHSLFALRRPVTVTLRREPDGALQGRCRTVVEHRSGRRVWARLPTDRGVAPRPFPLGSRVDVELGDAGGLYVCAATVERYAPCAAVPCVVLSLGAELLRRQRRNHVRVPTHLQVRLYDDGEIVPGVAQNLSAGGMLVALGAVGLKAQAEDRVVFELVAGRGVGPADAPAVYGEARVVRRGEGTAALEFDRLSDTDRAELQRYVMQRVLQLGRGAPPQDSATPRKNEASPGR
ncbi:MAG: PilZ domain-containing protein [Deltaproteobacteria bacterium]|nr:PilZ domain-containing protein [Deltaproteobacteria bacterium]